MGTEVSEFRPHWIAFSRAVVIWTLVFASFGYLGVFVSDYPDAFKIWMDVAPWASLILLAGFVFAVLSAWVRWRFSILTVYGGRIEYRIGFIRVRLMTVPLREIANMEVAQGAMQRVLGFGDLVVDMRGASLLRVSDVVSVQQVMALIRSNRDRLLAGDRL
ncbi:PH domain-containing protein [Microvirga tunisiensis]|uniref:PH domain-containing protein n=1 Tax=Microvirga tunisiensis TaxID=2108360 RepID=A0A5N7MAF3_9HYPH|nr:PH domain-containing protein [Microvirga tunisiensis]MPR05635.1 PH domain-containing protein [Microvirga tunisiensis]MPR23835.1 PH domain-containing protein [Microvirga tunisiensis]